MSKLLENFRAQEVSLGCLFMSNYSIGMPGLAKAGYAFVIVDMMYGWNTWRDVYEMCLAAKVSNLTSIVRLQSYPWGKRDEGDHRIAVDAARAASLGADGVMVSVDSVEDARMLAEISKDWHRAGHLQASKEELAAHESRIHEELIILPGVESTGGLEDIEEIVNLEAVNAFMISGSDLPRQLGVPWEYEHPDVWKYMDRAVSLAHSKGIPIGTNSGWIYRDVPETVDRIKRLRDHGMDFVLTQTGYHMLHSYAAALSGGLEKG